MSKQTTVPGAEAVAETVRHSKDDLMASGRFGECRDLLAALLEDGKEYTAAEAEAMAANYLGKKVE